MFLHKCCFLIEDDMSIASFDKSCSTISRASLAGYELQTMFDKEIIYIKKSPKVWYEIEDESSCVGSETDDASSLKTKSSNSKDSSRRSSANEKHVVIGKYKPVTSKTFSKETGKGKIILVNAIRNSCKNELRIIEKKPLTSIHIAESSSYIFPSKKPVASSTSRMLDWFMSCCWRCSFGCQQLPTLNM